MSVRKRVWRTVKGERREVWCVDYVDAQGRRCHQTFALKREAEAAHTKIKGEVSQGVHTAPSRSISVADACDDWLAYIKAEGRERTTLEQYGQHVRLHIVPTIGREKVAKLTTPAVHAFRDELLSRLSRPMARAVLTSLKAVLKDAQRRGHLSQNVARDVIVGASTRGRKKLKVGVDIPAPEKIRALVGALKNDRWRPFFLTAVFSGLRASELRGLSWTDVDLKKAELHVRQRADRFNAIGAPKSEAGTRSVPLTPLVANVLREWKLRCPKGTADLVFPTSRGTVQRHENIIRDGLLPAMKRAGLKGKYGGLHALRHFFASWCINPKERGGRGLPLKEVQTLLGHASIMQTADTYGHLFPRGDDTRELAAAERALLGAQATIIS